jgi:hypothetical protein
MFVLKSGADMIASQRNARATNAAATAEAQSRTQQIQQTQMIGERRKREQLRLNLARQRARFGATGIGRGGSADAVLRGLTNETDRIIAEERSLNAFPINRINAGLRQTRRNLLEASSARRRKAFLTLGQDLSGISLLES